MHTHTKRRRQRYRDLNIQRKRDRRRKSDMQTHSQPASQTDRHINTDPVEAQWTQQEEG